MLPESLDVSTTGRPSQWWDREASEIERVFRIAKRLRDHQGDDREADADDALALYFGNCRNTIDTYSAALSYLGEEPPGYNVVQACVDTLSAHLVKQKVRPFFLTERGSGEQKEKALGMQRVCEATLEQSGMWGEMGMLVCFDGNLFEAGGVMWTPDYANLRVIGERIFPWEFFVPEREAKRGNPRQGHLVRPVPRDSLLDFFKDASAEVRQAILDAPPLPADESSDDLAEPGEVADLVLMADSWHLPSGRVDRSKPEAWGYDANGNAVDPPHDGRHMTSIDGRVLFDEPWPFDYFPIAWFKPRKKPVGYWSRSAAETLAGAQLALNRMNKRVDGIMHMHSRPLLYVWRRAKLNTDKITNAHASIIEGDQPAGQAIQYITPQSVPAEYLARIREIIAWAEKQFGLSEMAISAQKPKGVDHAPGMQHLSDEQSIRHTPAFQAWERLYVDSARMIVDCYRMLAQYVEQWNKDHPDDQRSLEVLWSDSKQLKRINWKDVDLAEDQYHLKVWPTNLLPQTPGAKASRIIEYISAGVMSPQEGRLFLLEFPDIESLIGEGAAEEENIRMKLDALKKGPITDSEMPHPYLNFELAKALTRGAINRAEVDGLGAEVVNRLTQFYELVIEEEQRLAPPAPAPMGPPQGGPPGGMPGEVPNITPAGPLPGMGMAA